MSKDAVSEKDKPFVLALVGTGLFACEVGAAVVCAFKGVTVQDLTDAIKFTGTLVAMAWTYYFASNKNASQAAQARAPA